MGRAPCCSKVGLQRGPWTPREDTLLKRYIEKHGEGNWRTVPNRAGLLRCGKSCRLRWMNYLRPNIKRGNIESDEDDLIIKLHALLGNRWSLIARRLPGRTDNEIKNYWSTHLSKNLRGKGIDPTTHTTLVSTRCLAEEPANDTIRKRKLAAAENHEESKRDTAKIHAPKATRVNPFIFFPAHRDDTMQTLNQMQEIEGVSMAVSGAAPDEGVRAVEELQPSPIEKNDQISTECPTIAEFLSSSSADVQNWLQMEDPNCMLDNTCYGFLDDPNYLLDQEDNCCTMLDQQGHGFFYDDLDWDEQILM